MRGLVFTLLLHSKVLYTKMYILTLLPRSRVQYGKYYCGARISLGLYSSSNAQPPHTGRVFIQFLQNKIMYTKMCILTLLPSSRVQYSKYYCEARILLGLFYSTNAPRPINKNVRSLHVVRAKKKNKDSQRSSHK